MLNVGVTNFQLPFQYDLSEKLDHSSGVLFFYLCFITNMSELKVGKCVLKFSVLQLQDL